MAKRFIPVEQEWSSLHKGQKPLPRLVAWYVLIRDAEDFRRETGWGLASIWERIYNDDYESARRRMDELIVERREHEATRPPT
jgi:hypothetical protein